MFASGEIEERRVPLTGYLVLAFVALAILLFGILPAWLMDIINSFSSLV
jgi:hypothetical protein